MIQTTLTAALLAATAFVTPVNAEVVDAWCSLFWRDGRASEQKTGDCDFRQAFGNATVWLADHNKNNSSKGNV